MNATLKCGLAMVLVTLSATLARAAEVPIKEQWAGVVQDDALKAQSPASHAVVDKQSWETLWKAWRANEPVPAVNFSEEIVLVALVSGPNRARLGRLNLDEKGNIQLIAMSTRMGGPGFGYAFARVSKEGIKSVDGVALPLAAATKPATQPK